MEEEGAAANATGFVELLDGRTEGVLALVLLNLGFVLNSSLDFPSVLSLFISCGFHEILVFALLLSLSLGLAILIGFLPSLLGTIHGSQGLLRFFLILNLLQS